MTHYSALIDLVGVRELAVDTPSQYMSLASNFRATLEQVFVGRSTTRVFFFRDHCYIEDQSRDSLLDAIRELRYELLLHDGINVRGALASGSVNAKRIRFPTDVISSETAPLIIEGFDFGELASKLFGLLESLKAIGVVLDPDLCVAEPDVMKETVESFFASEGRTRRYSSFRDLSFRPGDLTRPLLGKLVSNFRHSRASSRKVGRFFVAPLLSWARLMDMSSNVEPTLDQELVAGHLSRVRDVAGIELVHLALLDRIYSPKASSYDQPRVNALKRFFLDAKSLHALIRSHDYNAAPIPPSILTGASRRAFIADLAKYEKQKRAGTESGNMKGIQSDS